MSVFNDVLNKIEKWFVNRHFKKRHIHVDSNDKRPSAEFRRVLNTLRENKVIVDTRSDGIYIRLAGNENKSQILSKEFIKIKSF